MKIICILEPIVSKAFPLLSVFIYIFYFFFHSKYFLRSVIIIFISFQRELEAGSKETDSISGGERTDSDGYEEIGAGIGSDPTTQIHNNRPSVMELSRGHSGQRTLWCQLPEVSSTKTFYYIFVIYRYNKFK